MPGEIINCVFKVSGIVQGVGFRPFVFNLAKTFNLRGSVCNDGDGVAIEVEGETEKVAGFAGALIRQQPPLARIEHITSRRMPLKNYTGFTVIESQGKAKGKALIPPDTATCAKCREELANPSSRHYRYPFTNCTNCGPRFTIACALPYDRRRTAMDVFPMCPDCRREYHDAADRRFHAQPTACSACGPAVVLVDRRGNTVGGGDWAFTAARLLREGHILAVKGLGGFHLACNAADRATVLRLRRLKHRPFKPFAVMCRDIETAAGHCKISPAESELLKSPAAPIVLLAKRPDSSLPPELAPGLDTLGVMLPYTPLHLLLMQEGPPVLVLTSGNRGGLPIVIDNRQALDELGYVADYFIMHDREIFNRCDDSVTMVIGGGLQFLRRSRGFVPEPLKVPVPAGMRVVLGMGGDMKNAFCLLNGDKAFMSQHIGEMDTLEGVKSFKRALESLCRLTGIQPEVIVCDLHPGYASSRLAGDLAKKLGMLRHGGVQHHHAHMASCMAENALDGDVIGVILDGTGYGLDGKIWGFEIMWGGYGGFHRGYHLDYVPLPGGDRAVRNPWLTAAAYLMTFLGYGALDAARLFPEYRRELETAEKMLSAKLNSPPASSCGRFFDAVAALLGVCRENTYEGQAAVALGSLAPWFPSEPGRPCLSAELEPYPFDFRGDVIDPSAVLSHIIEDIHGKTPARIIVKRFHDTIIAIVADAARKVRAKTGISRVVLSGGTWHNRYLSGMAKIVLEQNGFEVFAHHHVPPGDGGIALGQAAAAAVQFVKRPGAPALCRGSK